TEDELRRRQLRLRIFALIKIAVFLIFWLICSVYIIITPPHTLKEIYVPLQPNKVQTVDIEDKPTGETITIAMRGNIDLIATMHPKQSDGKSLAIDVAIEVFKGDKNESSWKSKVWKVYVEDEDPDIVITVTNRFRLDDMPRTYMNDLLMGRGVRAESGSDAKAVVTLLSHHGSPVGMGLTINANPVNEDVSVWLGLILLIFLYVLIGFDITDRTFAALIAATGGIGILCILDERPALMEIIRWIEVETMMLLFGMMVIVSIVSETGIFDRLTVFAYQLARGRIWLLLFYLYMLTGILSAFLDNVTVVMLLVPVTIRMCELLGINTVVVLISIALFSNIGGTMTPVGDPPNVIIVSNRFIHAAGIHFCEFTLHIFPCVVVAMLLSFVMVYYMTRGKVMDSGDQLQRSIDALEKQAAISKDTHYNRKIMKHIEVLKERQKQEKAKPKGGDDYETTLKDLKANQNAADIPLLIKCIIAIFVAILLFLLSSIPHLKGVMLSWAAILAALLLLILADRSDVDSILERVEWSTLIFFAALFVFMESLVKMGLIDCISKVTTKIIHAVDDDSQLIVSLLLILWFTALSSAFVDNIPITALMLKLVIKLSTNLTLDLPLNPLVWALVFGAGFGGNGTLIGASANVVTIGIAKQHGYAITFRQFLFIGFPVMIMTVVIATIYLLIFHCAITWH
ncbi:hypothetical protein KR093_002520, partial [Drosophila rubida]